MGRDKAYDDLVTMASDTPLLFPFINLCEYIFQPLKAIKTKKRGGGEDWEFGIDMYTLLYLRQITSKDLL